MSGPVTAGVDVARSLPQHHLRWRPTSRRTPELAAFIAEGHDPNIGQLRPDATAKSQQIPADPT